MRHIVHAVGWMSSMTSRATSVTWRVQGRYCIACEASCTSLGMANGEATSWASAAMCNVGGGGNGAPPRRRPPAPMEPCAARQRPSSVASLASQIEPPDQCAAYGEDGAPDGATHGLPRTLDAMSGCSATTMGPFFCSITFSRECKLGNFSMRFTRPTRGEDISISPSLRLVLTVCDESVSSPVRFGPQG